MKRSATGGPRGARHGSSGGRLRSLAPPEANTRRRCHSLWPAFASSVLAGSLALGCGPSFEPESRIETVRILAVRKDKPYAHPGDTVTATMLVAEHSTDAARPLQIAWLAGCENPPGDLYAGCLTQFADAGTGTGDAGTFRAQPGTGLAFAFHVSETIISRRPPPSNPKQPPYGVAYVFFAACAGTLRPVPVSEGKGFPVACFSSTGQRLGDDAFVIGYTAVYVYEDFTNRNPRVTGFTVGGQPVTPECIDEGCIPLEAREFGVVGPSVVDAGLADAGAGDAQPASRDAGGPALGDASAAPPLPFLDGGNADGGPGACTVSSNPACVPVCLPNKKCTKTTVQLEVDPASVERDTVVEAQQGGNVDEQMWIDYYTEDGSLSSATKLLNDTTLGFIAKHGVDFTPPATRGPVRIWGVAHDSRGGTSWARIRLDVR
jgi:hypothetical protein